MTNAPSPEAEPSDEQSVPVPAEAARPGPPAPGKVLSVRVDEDLYDDLALIMRTGCTASDAVRQAVMILATVYDAAWARNHYPVGVAPQITQATFARYQPPTTPRPNRHV